MVQFSKYFLNWAEKPEVEGAFSRDYFEIGNYLNSLSPTIKKYVIVNEIGVPFYGLSIPAQVPIFIESTAYCKPRAEYIPSQEIDQIELSKEETVIIPLYRNGMEEKLKGLFPQGEIEHKQGFWVYKIMPIKPIIASPMIHKTNIGMNCNNSLARPMPPSRAIGSINSGYHLAGKGFNE